ncbi:AAA domain-containing protein [Helicobacter sp. T3_23-1059]
MNQQTQLTKTALTNATTIYYEYLEQNNLGCEQLQILRTNIDSSVIKFFIKAKFVNPDALMMDLNGKYLPLSDEAGFSVLFYDEKTGVLAIECLDFALLETIKNYTQDIKIFSDLKFLITNLEIFFKKAERFALPSIKPCVVPTQKSIKDYLNEEQKNALLCALNTPFSYIWGAPGSGKTQVVLFEALLCYIYEGLPVCVLAPTNSALEQVLSALIRKFDELGLNREKILRLGTPSNSFLEKYTEVCDPQVLAKKAKENLFSSNVPKNRIKEAIVIGMTMDGFIAKQATLGIDFHHFFLDECAFTPLIKALALTTQNAPITLLGDHKQLMPICEMPPSQIKGDKIWANLFNLSSLFLEDFFENPAESNAPIFSKSQSSTLSFIESKNAKTTFCTLRQTHRYGDNLAKILDSHIYHNGLKGKEQDTQIFYIDCPNAIIEDKQNITEANTIASLINEVQKARHRLNPNDSNDSKDSMILKNFEDYAVITPFVKQKKLLSKCGVSYRAVWTIHGSQGQEFDTVIFSPVMLHHHLTDSHNTNAAYALNVAISRIKKQLIIVCDRAYWLKFRGQFLSEILANALPFPLQTTQPQQSKQAFQTLDTKPALQQTIEIVEI